MDRTKEIFCCSCKKNTSAFLTSGASVYPHRKDLSTFPFWQCPECKGFVGCHHRSSNPTRPLGCIPSPEVKEARKKIHALIDPVWKSRRISRSKLYKEISKSIGREYHTGEIRSIEEARAVWKAAKEAIAKHG